MNKRYQVFVSSTYTDLIEERKEVTQAILKCDCFPAGMELFPASNKKQWTIIKKVIDDSDFYLLIIAGRYGSLGIDDNGKKIGYTEMEFNYALSKGKPIIVMIHDSPELLSAKFVEKSQANIQRLNKFKEKAINGRMVSFWNNKDQLHSAVLNSLHKAMQDTPEAVGWIRANSVTYNSKITEVSVEQVFSKFEELDSYEDKLNYLNSVKFSDIIDLFKIESFVKYYISLINKEKSNKNISKAINTIPYYYHLDSKIIDLISTGMDIKSLFNIQYNDTSSRDNDLFISIIKLLCKLRLFSIEYSRLIFNTLISNQTDTNVKNMCVFYFEYHNHSYNNEIKKEMIEYILNELQNENRVLSICQLINLLVASCVYENDFILLYNVFMNNDQEIQKNIINYIFQYCGSELYITTPKIQRMFFDLCDVVYSWNDDDISTRLLLYCLFTRTYDIFTIDEIFNKLNEFNDDVFYMFMWQLGYQEFGSDFEEYYELDDNEYERIKIIIEKRKHPRGHKLLEYLKKSL